MKYIKILSIIFLAQLATSCDDLLEIEPTGEIIESEALKTPEDVQALLNSAYDALRGTGGDWAGGRIQAIAEVMGENIDGNPGNLNNADLASYYNKTTSFFTGYTQNMFDEPYFVIYRANVLLQAIETVPGLTDADKLRISGEAKFLRAICHFDLVKLFAHPYGFTADNSHLGVVVRTVPEATPRNRNTVAETYTQIVQDLTDATEELPTDNGSYANAWSAKGYLAKVYFHMHQFDDAYAMANDVIENGPNVFDTDETELMDRFSAGESSEAVFKQVSVSNADHRGTQFSSTFRSDGATQPVLRISRDMYDLATEDPTDKRGQNWYKIENEGETNERISILKFDGKNFFDVPMITVTELKFIRAESAAENDETQLALNDINDIRNRAGLTAIDSDDVANKAALLRLIRVEKRKEHVAEGVYFHDLRRIGAKGESITIRGSDWDCPGMAIQFPDGEIAGAGGVGNFTPNTEGGC